jgi:hypothetical protein
MSGMTQTRADLRIIAYLLPQLAPPFITADSVTFAICSWLT